MTANGTRYFGFRNAWRLVCREPCQCQEQGLVNGARTNSNGYKYSLISPTKTQSFLSRPTTHSKHSLKLIPMSFNCAFSEDVLLCPFLLEESAERDLFLGLLRINRPWFRVKPVPLWLGHQWAGVQHTCSRTRCSWTFAHRSSSQCDSKD